MNFGQVMTLTEISTSIAGSPIPYRSMSRGQLVLMLALIASTAAVLAALGAVSWARQASPRSRLWSIAGIGHALWIAVMVTFAIACAIGAIL